MSSHGAKVIEADLTDNDAVAALPDAAYVIFLVGSKFGTSGREHSTWATNSYLPGRIIQRFPTSRIVALSTGNVYPLVPVGTGGCTEATRPDPVGEYAMSCLGRERILEHFSILQSTPVALIRLNYAVEMRYGVLVDVARAVIEAEPIDVAMGHVNLVWQGYANEVILRSLRLAASPPFVLNLTGPELVSIRQVALSLGELMDRAPMLVGLEAPTALLSNAQRCHVLFGYPDISLEDLIGNVADWVSSGLPLLDKPTGFERRDGRF
jgi:nucleoside-diphosphate-sugar epimerase